MNYGLWENKRDYVTHKQIKNPISEQVHVTSSITTQVHAINGTSDYISTLDYLTTSYEEDFQIQNHSLYYLTQFK